VVLVRLSFMVQSIYADVCLSHDLTPAQAQLLCVLKDQPRGMTELTRILRLERPGLSGLVDRVQQRGLVQRQAAQQDRRLVTLVSTPAGKLVTEKFYRDVSDRLTSLLTVLPAEERRQFERIGSKILTIEHVPPVFGRGEADPC
jgi:DNA-binding MarR family transcriptional regulator